MEKKPWYQVAHIDLRRTMIFSSWQIGFIVPFWLRMYLLHDRLFPQVTVANAVKRGLASWFTAWTTYPLFFTYTTIAGNLTFHENKRRTYTVQQHWGEAKERIVKEVPELMLMNIMFWAPHWIPQFYLIPGFTRLLYGGLISLGWQSILSWVQNRDSKTTSAAATNATPAAAAAAQRSSPAPVCHSYHGDDRGTETSFNHHHHHHHHRQQQSNGQFSFQLPPLQEWFSLGSAH